MSTTNLFVELVVIGTGAAVWVTLAVFAVFDYTWVSYDKAKDLPALIPGLCAIYVLGVVMDRLADWLFGFRAEQLRREFFKNPEDYHKARIFIYTRAEGLRDLFEYGRSRLRICRGWALNSVLIVVTLNLFAWTRLPADELRWKISLFGTLAFGLLAYGAWLAGQRLARAELVKLRDQYAFLLAEEAKGPARSR